MRGTHLKEEEWNDCSRSDGKCTSRPFIILMLRSLLGSPHALLPEPRNILPPSKEDTSRLRKTRQADRVCSALQEVQQLYRLIQGDINPQKIVQQALLDLPALSRQLMLGWSDKILSS